MIFSILAIADGTPCGKSAAPLSVMRTGGVITLTDLAGLMARHDLAVIDVAKITGASEKTIRRWLDDETSARKPCPLSAYRLLLIVTNEAKPEDFRP